jgi:hypothetical protein
MRWCVVVCTLNFLFHFHVAIIHFTDISGSLVSFQDEDKDGVFTAKELIKWIETNKLVKFESEGRDAEMDKIMESQAAGKEEATEEPQRQKV